MLAKIAMMAITTKSSISVKPLTRDLTAVSPGIEYCLKSFMRPPIELNVHLSVRIDAIGAEHFYSFRKMVSRGHRFDVPITEQKTNVAGVLFPDFSDRDNGGRNQQFDERKARAPRADVADAAPGLR